MDRQPDVLAGLHVAEGRAVRAFAETTRERFGSRLRHLLLFGSRARGEGHDESDVDILVVVDDLTFTEGNHLAWLAGDLLTEHGVVLSPFAVSTEHWDRLRSLERRIVSEIDRDGLPL